MGPPIYIGGNPKNPPSRAVRYARFNGATDLYRWKLSVTMTAPTMATGLQWGHRFISVETVSDGDEQENIEPLQWGHRFISVETPARAARLDARLPASMGPPIYIGGNMNNSLFSCTARVMLQWGHRFISVETTDCLMHKVATPWLQWGHRFISVETAGSIPAP